jgi:hypothetical protein
MNMIFWNESQNTPFILNYKKTFTFQIYWVTDVSGIYYSSDTLVINESEKSTFV